MDIRPNPAGRAVLRARSIRHAGLVSNRSQASVGTGQPERLNGASQRSSGSGRPRRQGPDGWGAARHGLARWALAAASTIVLAMAPGVAQAGSVIVHFIQPSQYTDIGQFDSLQQDPLVELQHYLVFLGEQLLPGNQVLTVNFLDIDLAGTSRPTRDGAANVRLMRSAGDAPSLTLDYRLEENGRLLASGKQDLTDLQFLYHYRRSNQETSYPYEKRLLAQWFKNTVAQAGIHPH